MKPVLLTMILTLLLGSGYAYLPQDGSELLSTKSA
jgi:hypothetical protein